MIPSMARCSAWNSLRRPSHACKIGFSTRSSNRLPGRRVADPLRKSALAQLPDREPEPAQDAPDAELDIHELGSANGRPTKAMRFGARGTGRVGSIPVRPVRHQMLNCPLKLKEFCLLPSPRGREDVCSYAVRVWGESGLEGLVPDHQRPRDPCVLFGEGDGGDVSRASRQEVAQPGDVVSCAYANAPPCGRRARAAGGNSRRRAC
jgi:hypothetical protein